jgi:hypothetical protein
MAKDNRIRKMGSDYFIAEGCDDYDDEAQRSHTSPESPTNLRYARSHAELAGRKDPALSEGVSFTEKLETRDYYNWD